MNQIFRQRRWTGVALMLGGLVVNPWTVAYLATDDGTIDVGYIKAALLFLSLTGVLGGLQLIVRWVEPLAWGHRVGLLRGGVAVAAIAAIGAGVHWRVTTYASGHQHDHGVQVPTGHDHGTSEQAQWAGEFYRRSLAAAMKHGWFDIDNALAQGFERDRVNGTHFPNQQNLFDDAILDPERPEWLMYSDSPNGKVLTGFMYFTRSLDEVGPTPGGPLTQWHFHPYGTPRCAIKELWTIGKADDEGRCAEGVPVTHTPQMLHVWFVDHPLGRFTAMNLLPDNLDGEWFDLATLHPIIVHFAIALFVIAVLLDLAALATRRAAYHHAAWINLALAAVAAAAAVAAGMQSEVALNPTHEAHLTLDVHKLLGYGSLAAVLVLAGWRFALRGRFPSPAAGVLYMALSVAGAAAISGAGYYGGEMVYRHGAGVQALDRFARDRYFDQVREIYRADPALMNEADLSAAPDHSGHTAVPDHAHQH